MRKLLSTAAWAILAFVGTVLGWAVQIVVEAMWRWQVLDKICFLW